MKNKTSRKLAVIFLVAIMLCVCKAWAISFGDAKASAFSAKIEMKDGVPVVTWEPNLNSNGVIRTYKVYGSETLENGGNWQYPTNSLHRFFKVTVEMP